MRLPDDVCHNGHPRVTLVHTRDGTPLTPLYHSSSQFCPLGTHTILPDLSVDGLNHPTLPILPLIAVVGNRRLDETTEPLTITVVGNRLICVSEKVRARKTSDV